jgi:hypothetical protein
MQQQDPASRWPTAAAAPGKRGGVLDGDLKSSSKQMRLLYMQSWTR